MIKMIIWKPTLREVNLAELHSHLEFSASTCIILFHFFLKGLLMHISCGMIYVQVQMVNFKKVASVGIVRLVEHTSFILIVFSIFLILNHFLLYLLLHLLLCLLLYHNNFLHFFFSSASSSLSPFHLLLLHHNYLLLHLFYFYAIIVLFIIFSLSNPPSSSSFSFLLLFHLMWDRCIFGFLFFVQHVLLYNIFLAISYSEFI